MDPPFSPTTKVYHPKFSFDDIGVTSSTTDEFFDTTSFISNPSFASSSPTTEANRRAYHPRFSSDHISITSSISDTLTISETDSFVYDPSLASSQTSIASYKTEKSVISRKSRYNDFPRHKYAGVGQSSLPSGPASSDVDSAVTEIELRDESDGTTDTIKTAETEAHQRGPSTSTTTERESTIDDILKTVERFRILSVGRSGVGKSSLITRVFDIDAAHVEDHKPGEADIQREFVSPDNRYVVLHDSKGFEPGDLSNFETVREFVRARQKLSLCERIHGLWLCTETPTAGGRIFETGDEKLLQFAHKDQVPIVIVFTQYDRLVRTKEAELREDHPHMDPTRLRDRGVEEAQRAFQDCLESLKRTMNRLRIPMPRYATVSVRPGHQEDISSLVEVTRDVVKERVKGDAWVLWAIAQRASLPVKINACVTKGISYYRRTLMDSRRGAPELGPMLLRDCIGEVHKDIIACWDFKGEVLNSPEFRQLMLCLVQDAHTRPNVSMHVLTRTTRRVLAFLSVSQMI